MCSNSINYNQVSEKIIQKPYVFFIIICLFSNIFFITNNFLYWDDWCWTSNTFSDYIYLARMLGLLPARGLFLAIIYLLPPYVSRIIVMLLILGTTFVLYKINDYVRISRNANFFISLFYLLNPIVVSKYSLCIAHYYLSIFEFAFASYLLICKYNVKFLRLISIIFYVLSFSLTSLCCFYAVPFMYIFYVEIIKNQEGMERKTLLWSFIKKYLIFLLVPFIFYFFKFIFLKPLGAYANDSYNALKIKYIFTFPLSYFKGVFENFFYFISPNGAAMWYTPIVMLFVAGFIWKKRIYKDPLIIFCLLSFIFAIFPYSIVGKQGNVTGESRHYILCLYPSSLLLVLIIKKITRDDFRKFFYVIISILFIFENINTGLVFFREQMICESFIENIKLVDDIRNNCNFAFHEVNNYSEPHSNYGLYGLFWKAFGDEKRYAYNIDIGETSENINIAYNRKDGFPEYPPYKIKDMKLEEPKWQINFEVKNLGSKKIVIGYFLRLFNLQRYQEWVKTISTVTISSL